MLRGFSNQTPFVHQAPAAAAKDAPPKSALLERRDVTDKASLASLFLATKKLQPLQVPPHPVKTPLEPPRDHFFSHLFVATRVDDHLLHVPKARAKQQGAQLKEQDQYFILGRPINAEGNHTLRGMRKLDQELPQIYMVKEIPLAADDAADLLGPPHSLLLAHGLSPAMERIANGVNNQAAIDHPMTPHFSLITPDTLYLAMPQLGANVFDVLSHVRSERSSLGPGMMNMPVRVGMAYKMLQGVLKSLSFLHDQRLAHRDVKLENMALRQDGDVYLIDFDSSLHVDEQVPTTGHTVDYMAPEARQGGAFDPRPADIWSLGVALVVTLLARNPFAAAAHGDDGDFLAQWQAGLEGAQQPLPPPAAAAKPSSPGALVHGALRQAAPTLYPMLLRMLDTRPQERATAPQLEQMLEALPSAERPDLTLLLRELRAQVQNQDMPAARAIAQDTRLMQVQPGERATGRPALRRANSVDTLVRPFVQPFDGPPPAGAQEHVAQAKALRDWHESPTFLAVQQFLYDQEQQWMDHLAEHPVAAERLYGDAG